MKSDVPGGYDPCVGRLGFSKFIGEFFGHVEIDDQGEVAWGGVVAASLLIARPLDRESLLRFIF